MARMVAGVQTQSYSSTGNLTSRETGWYNSTESQHVTTTACSPERPAPARRAHGAELSTWCGCMERDDDGQQSLAVPERDTDALDGDLQEEGPPPLARVRYGLGKELRLYPDAFVVLLREEHEEMRYSLDSIHRMILSPGEYNPSKLVLMFDLDDDDTTVIAAEGMSNVRDFRKLLATLREIRPEIELDPPNMDEQLMQALDIRKRSLIGCYGLVAGCGALLWVIYIVVAWIGAHAPH